MKNIYIIFGLIFLFSVKIIAQKGYDIKFKINGCKDTTMFLAKYYFDQTSIIDSCKHVKNGNIQFKGSLPLDRGVYILVNQDKARYIDFIINDNQNFTINGEYTNLMASLKCIKSKENDELFSYAKFMMARDKDFGTAISKIKGKSKADSLIIVNEKQKIIAEEIKKFDKEFLIRNKGNFVFDFMNLRTEKYPETIPNASNGRPDSIYQYYYYKNHFFDGVNFKDERIMFTPFFGEKIKRFSDQVLVQQPDSIIRELDKILSQCLPGTLVFNTLIGHFTYKYETNKALSFDQFGNCNTFEKVFVYLADNYICNGKAEGIYDDATILKIKDRVNILRKLLPGQKVTDLQMIDTLNGKQVLNMGFDTTKTSAGATFLYNKHAGKLSTMYKTLYEINAKYTILVFWAADCGHCQKEVPKLYKDLQSIKGSVDFKVYAVQTKEELFNDWKKFISENNLKDFIHVFDPVHINNIKETFDITGTPVIFLLDKDKKVKAKKLAADQVVDIIKNLETAEKNLIK